MKAINYTDIKRVYSDTVITLELIDGTTFKAYEFDFMNDEQINNSDEMLVEMIEVKDDSKI
ncbi:hypothetical protein [Finegoldia magna]|uniref:Uncharacterized protein n=1 Tax=Finegoldia magna BVS033A4 TaxID=866773 RepID=E1KWK0_FINMA|nr:hypothetical protein [Finegoldia magna]EFL54680.1 hypothetical protein HMPREF9289_0739 [Finegoldia magna BVS033A4]MDU5071085.1 hypothetical protein [Finegoldia magna]